ncbi:MAG: DUF2935 domain-containing protein [Clostridia bacterium]
MNEYSFESLELHLFFSRIMKEHALFLEAGFSNERYLTHSQGPMVSSPI